MKVAVTLKKTGNRIYIDGNTFPIRDQLKNIGCHWDSDERKWWIGAAKKEELDRVLKKMEGQDIKENVDRCRVEGKVKYKGKIWYIIASSIKSSEVRFRISSPLKLEGLRVRLTNLQGTIHFWAEGSECEVVKMYDSSKKPQTLAQLREFVEQIKKESPEEREERKDRRWAYENFGGICRCSRPLDEGDGECLNCGYGIVRNGRWS